MSEEDCDNFNFVLRGDISIADSENSATGKVKAINVSVDPVIFKAVNRKSPIIFFIGFKARYRTILYMTEDVHKDEPR